MQLFTRVLQCLRHTQIVYKCPPASLVRSVRMVHERLLVVERQGGAQNPMLDLLGIMAGAGPGAGQTQAIWVVLAAPDGNGAYSKVDHERLNSAPAVNMGNVVSLCTARCAPPLSRPLPEQHASYVHSRCTCT